MYHLLFLFFCTVHWADLSWPPFHYWLYPVWLCMWQINENLEPWTLRSGMLSGQSSTVISWSANHLEVVLALWAGAKVLLEKEISISIKLVSRWKHKVLQNILVDCIDFGLDKTQWTNTSRRHGTPNHPWLPKLHTGLQASWILCLSSLPPWRLQTLISKRNGKFTFIWKEDFGPLSNSPVLVLLNPGKMLLTLSLVQKWLGSPFPEDVWAWWLLMHWLQLQSTPCEALTSVYRLCLTVFSSFRSSLLLVHLFLPNFFLQVNFAFNMLWYSTLLTVTPFCNDLKWLTLFGCQCSSSGSLPSQQSSPLLWF